MNPRPDKSIIEEVALLKQISESFIEKDWYVVQAIKKISEISYRDFQMVFTGGTALSKAHKLLQRFSEDSDFRVISPSLLSESKSRQRRILSDLKEIIFASLLEEFQVNPDKVIARNANQFIALEINYPTQFPPAGALRPHLQVEFTVTSLALPAIQRQVSSFVNEETQKAPEVDSIACIDPIENAADKLSAITWRIPDRIRGRENDDPDIVRHLHDLAILSNVVTNNPAFRQLTTEAIHRDDKRSSAIAGLSINAKFDAMLKILDDEYEEYSKEYDRFVMGMSYASDGSTPSFRVAIGKLKRLITSIV